MSNFSKKMQERMQQKMQDLQVEIKKVEVTGTSANDLVKITLSGEQKVKKVEINKDVVNPDDIDALQDLVHIAIDDALTQLQEKTRTMFPGLDGLGM